MTGAFKAILKTAIDLKKEHDFLFLIPSKASTASILDSEGFRYVELPFIEISRRWQHNLLYFLMLLINGFRLAKLVKREGIDIVHTNDLHNLTPIVGKWLSRYPLMVHIRRMPQSFPLPLYRIWVKLWLRYADRIVGVSKANTVAFGKAKKISAVYDRHPDSEQYAQYEVKGDKKTATKLLYLANYIRGKGQNHALEAVRIALQKRPNLHLTLVGSDMGLQKNRAFKAELEARVKTWNLEAHFTFKGSTDDVEQAMKAHDIVLNFSDAESFSRVSLEALFYGLPLIATDVGGTSEMFDNDVSGLLVPMGDVAAMAAAIVQLSGDVALRQQFSTNAYQHIRQHFNKVNTSAKLSDLYREMIE